MTRLCQNRFPTILWITVISLFLSTTGAGQSRKAKTVTPIPTSTTCGGTTGLYCETYGSGDPVMFIHGLGASLYSWRNMVAPLETDYKLILLDLKGFGKSPKPNDKRYSVQDQADLLFKIILEQDLKNLTLVGNSYGGAVALLLTLTLLEKAPGRLIKLVLVDSAGYDKLLPWHLKLLRTPVLGWLALHLIPARCNAKSILKFSYYNDKLITDAQITAYAQPLTLPGAKRALLRTAKQAIPKNIKQLIAKYPTISVPTLIIWGAKDKVIPIEIGNMLDEAIPCSKLVQIPLTGHVPQEETPDPTVAHIKDFLKNSIPCP